MCSIYFYFLNYLTHRYGKELFKLMLKLTLSVGLYMMISKLKSYKIMQTFIRS